MKSIIIFSVLLTISNAAITDKVNVRVLDRELRGSENTVNILTVIDTDTLQRAFENGGSKDADNPTSISHDYSYMIAPNRSVITGQATADLNVKMHVNDNLRFYGSSESGNSDSSIIVYYMKKNDPNNVLTEPRLDHVRNIKCLFPKKDSIKDLVQLECHYTQVQMTSLGTGQVFFNLYFAMFTMETNESGEHEPRLFGYFQWDPTITIQY